MENNTGEIGKKSVLVRFKDRRSHMMCSHTYQDVDISIFHGDIVATNQHFRDRLKGDGYFPIKGSLYFVFNHKENE